MPPTRATPNSAYAQYSTLQLQALATSHLGIPLALMKVRPFAFTGRLQVIFAWPRQARGMAPKMTMSTRDAGGCVPRRLDLCAYISSMPLPCQTAHGPGRRSLQLLGSRVK